MTRPAAAALLMALAGCAAGPPAEAGEVPVRGGGTCDSAKAQGLVGRASDDRLGSEALRLTGARTVRIVPEGGIVTMDFRADRVNLHLDGEGRVKRVACG